MGEKGYSGKELTLSSFPHPLQQRRIKIVLLAPIDPHREDSAEQDDKGDSRPPRNPDAQRRPSPHNKGRNVIAPQQPEGDGPEDGKFKRTKDRRPSPHPNQLQTDKVNVGGKRSPDFQTPEAVIQSGAVGGSVTNVDVHPHGEVKQAMVEQAMVEHSKEREGQHLSEGSAFERTLSRIKKYIWRRGPKPIPDTLPPIDDSYAKSASHPSLATESLGLPNINYSVSDSELSSEKAEVHPPPSSLSEESEDPNRRAASAPEPVKETESEDPRSRRAKSAAAVLETSRQSDHSDSEDDDEDSAAEFLHDDGSDRVSAGGTDTSKTELKFVEEDMHHVKSSEEAGSPPLDVVPSSSSTPQPGTSGLPLIIVTPEPELQSPQDPTSSTLHNESESLEDQQVPGPSKPATLRVPSPGPPKSLYSIKTSGPVEINVSTDHNTVTTCITFETTPPSSSDEEYNSGEFL